MLQGEIIVNCPSHNSILHHYVIVYKPLLPYTKSETKNQSVRYEMENEVSFGVRRIMLANFSCHTKCQRVIPLAKDKKWYIAGL